jgi:septum formation protein
MLILASASPRRAELLRNADIAFTAVPASVPEERRAGEDPVGYARRLAIEKARALAQRHPNNAVLGADTIVILQGEVLEKPRNSEEAGTMLRRLSGRTHEVTTGVCLISNGKERVESETTRVVMNEISEAEIKFYVATGEPMDKAGAYAIQGIASRWIPRIEGCYFNVVGLPVPLVWRMLRGAGLL